MKKMISNKKQLCYVTKTVIDYGTKNAQRLLFFSNGKISGSITLDQGIDIYQLNYEGKNIAYLSKNGVFPSYGNFSSSFPGGFLYTCGLDNIGHDNNLYTHGTFHLHPGELLEIEEGDFLLIKAKLNISSLFEEKIEVIRTISSSYNEDHINISDEIINSGFKDYSYLLLYHFNLGFPALTNETKLNMNFASINAFTNHSKLNNDLIPGFPMPKDNADETVHLLLENDGIINVTFPNIKKEMTLEYNPKDFPFLFIWKSYQSGDYALGIEPANSSLYDKKKSTIKAQERRIFNFKINFKSI